MGSSGTFLAFAFFSSFLANVCYCINVKSFNSSLVESGFLSAVATWYNDPTAAGSGGACGLENDVAKPPYNGMITAGNQALFLNGKGCGICYHVKCTSSPLCSGAPIRVTLTDECPGACNNDPVHFDLSAIAFGAMAKPGHANPLRVLGRINVQYRRVPCSYRRRAPIVFKVDKGSNPYWLGVTVEGVNGDGDVGRLEMQPAASNQWLPMKQSFGATYVLDVPTWAIGHSYSIRLTQGKSGRSVVAHNVIPAHWKPRKRYRANINF